MNTKSVLQVLLALGCLAFVMAVLESLAQHWWIAAPETWFRGAIGCWVLIIAVRTVYPAQQK
jgi:hypothetical protein